MKKKPLVLGHRGYRKKFPENTILAFNKAFEYGADGIECDVQKSLDGVYFIFHDVELHRMTGSAGDISNERSSKIKKLKIEKKQNIPDLDTFLNSLPHDKLVNIELKEETLAIRDCRIIIDKLNEINLKDNILISSFKHELLPPFKKAGFKTGMLFETETEKLKENPVKQIVNIFRLRPWSINPPVNVFIKPLSFSLKLFIFASRILRIKLIFWTVNTERQFDYVKRYAFAVITDDVETMMILREKE
jgi:glycerophosphoryl diester phosphodiesterase